MRLARGFCVALLIASSAALGAECTASSRQTRVPLLELYTSEGCDSCPPADRWVSELRARGSTGDKLVVLAFHVDYWDKLGWIDAYAQPRFSERQHLLNSRIGSRVVFTPQFVLNGTDYRRASRDDFLARVAAFDREPARAAIRLALKPAQDGLLVTGVWSAQDAGSAQGWLALYENQLSTDVLAGENRNKRLRHDFVVRDIAGPFPAGTLSHSFSIDSRWKRRDLAVAAFVQDARSADVLQALTLGVCS